MKETISYIKSCKFPGTYVNVLLSGTAATSVGIASRTGWRQGLRHRWPLQPAAWVTDRKATEVSAVYGCNKAVNEASCCDFFHFFSIFKGCQRLNHFSFYMFFTCSKTCVHPWSLWNLHGPISPGLPPVAFSHWKQLLTWAKLEMLWGNMQIGSDFLFTWPSPQLSFFTLTWSLALLLLCTHTECARCRAGSACCSALKGSWGCWSSASGSWKLVSEITASRAIRKTGATGGPCPIRWLSAAK